ncbi:hypothetical protein P170DRAFT_380384, partial [Aspergillus steynii IBT 23096]
MQSVVGGIVAVDPTGHAASAWAIVSLGLKMTQNDRMLQEKLFEASEFLTDVLARYTLVEKSLQKSHEDTSKLLNQSVIQLYASIMRYALEMAHVREAGVAERIWLSLLVPEPENQQLSMLRANIEKQDQTLQGLIVLDHTFRASQQGERLLAQIEQNSALVQKIDQDFQLSRLPFADKALNGVLEDLQERWCYKGTRHGLLQEIVNWVDNPGDKQFFWLNGMAGTGKSTISRTLAKLFKNRGILGASFFFKKGEQDCDSLEKFIPTVVRQLITFFPSLKHDIKHVIDKDDLIFNRSLEEQFEELFLKPLLNVRLPQRQTLVLILDAVDECQNNQDMMRIFEMLPRTQSPQGVDLRFFITGRPELAIREGLDRMQNRPYREKLLQDVEGVERDISVYMRAKLSEIKIRTPHGELMSWPEITIRRLTEKAYPLFIVASTICGFVGDKDFDPEERVEIILRQPHSDNKLAQTYRTILDQLVSGKSKTDKQEILQDFHRIVGSIILLYDPLPANSLARILGVSKALTNRRLGRLRSVLVIPDEAHVPIRPLHLSFRDILVDDSTSDMDPFTINTIVRHRDLADKCLEVMSDKKIGLRRNICGLENNGILSSEIDEIEKALSPELKYACRYWVKHLVDGQMGIGQGRIYAFFEAHFLHWLEAMGILGLVSEVLRYLSSMQRLFPETQDTLLTRFLSDAVRFTQRAADMISMAPLQVYSSALIFTPENSVVREMFNSQIPHDFVTLPPVEEDWGALLQSFQGPPERIQALGFSSDGRLLACSYDKNTIKLWDDEGMGSVQQIRTLSNSSESGVLISTFSPDGELLACSFQDGTLWDLNHQGSELRPKVLGNLISSCCALAFSRDNRRLACGFVNGVVQIWGTDKIASDSLWKESKMSSISVLRIALSPDGLRLAFSSRDKGLNLWEIEANGSGKRVHTLSNDDHSRSTCLVFSPDSRMLACASQQDGSIAIWDLDLKRIMCKVREGHRLIASTMCFSPDGRVL